MNILPYFNPVWDTLDVEIVPKNDGDATSGFDDAFFGGIDDLFNGHVPLAKTSDDIDMTVGADPSDSSKHQAVIRDKARQRAWSGEGGSPSEASTEAVKKFLGDRHSAEYVGKKQ